MRVKRRRVLVGVDGSNQAEEAVRYLSRMVPVDRCEIVFFHVMSKVPESFWDLEKDPMWQQKIEKVRGWQEQQERRMEECMGRMCQMLQDAGFPADSIRPLMLDRKEGIARDIAVLSREGFDAVVLGRRGTGQLQDPVLGSVADKLVGTLGGVPVWLVGGTPRRGKVLVAMDASEGAMRAMDHVAAMLEGTNADLTLFHAVRGIAVSVEGLEDIFPEGYQSRLLDEAQNAIAPALDAARKRLAEAGFSPDRIGVKIVTGVPSRAGAIIEEARANGYGTIVAGRRGVTRVEAFKMGRVCSKLTQMAVDCALWVVG